MYGNLKDDFDAWWSMRKYKTRDIPAKEHGTQLIKHRNGSNFGWPGPEKDVNYWVELDNGYAIGYRQPYTSKGRKARYVEFPIAQMPEKTLTPE
jgi:hypothetical protein